MILDYKTRAKDLPYAIKKEAIQKFIGKEINYEVRYEK